jgi:uncharacterized protein (TIGR02452 family)
MINRQSKLALIFNDTQKHYDTNERLRSAVEHAQAEAQIYLPDEPVQLPAISDAASAPKLTISGRRTFEAAKQLLEENPAAHVAVLNFASATNPGGGVLHGSSAQEESLCRCSTLYPTLDQRRFWDAYYHPHRAAGDVRYTDACIYTPDVVVFKSDDDYPELLPESEWFEVDVVTCAAPNLWHSFSRARNPLADTAQTVDDEELYRIHVSRGRRICEVAAAHGVDTLVLGAFGCGAFRNNPQVVARAYRAVLEEMGPYFERVEFAIFCMPGRESENYRAFRDVFEA